MRPPLHGQLTLVAGLRAALCWGNGEDSAASRTWRSGNCTLRERTAVMSISWKLLILTAGLLLTGGLAPAQEPLPQPRPLGPVGVPVQPYVPPAFTRTSHYQVWQYYGVDRQGFFKPLVVYSPSGAYYLYNGQPYPWAATHSLEWMPKVVEPVPFRPALQP